MLDKLNSFAVCTSEKNDDAAVLMEDDEEEEYILCDPTPDFAVVSETDEDAEEEQDEEVEDDAEYEDEEDEDEEVSTCSGPSVSSAGSSDGEEEYEDEETDDDEDEYEEEEEEEVEDEEEDEDSTCSGSAVTLIDSSEGEEDGDDEAILVPSNMKSITLAEVGTDHVPTSATPPVFPFPESWSPILAILLWVLLTFSVLLYDRSRLLKKVETQKEFHHRTMQHVALKLQRMNEIYYNEHFHSQPPPTAIVDGSISLHKVLQITSDILDPLDLRVRSEWRKLNIHGESDRLVLDDPPNKIKGEAPVKINMTPTSPPPQQQQKGKPKTETQPVATVTEVPPRLEPSPTEVIPPLPPLPPFPASLTWLECRSTATKCLRHFGTTTLYDTLVDFAERYYQSVRVVREGEHPTQFFPRDVQQIFEDLAETTWDAVVHMQQAMEEMDTAIHKAVQQPPIEEDEDEDEEDQVQEEEEEEEESKEASDSVENIYLQLDGSFVLDLDLDDFELVFSLEDGILVSKLEGSYIRHPIENPWHEVSVSRMMDSANETMVWSNKAGVSWNLDILSATKSDVDDIPRRVMGLGPDCPYYSGGQRHVEIEMNKEGLVTALVFQGERYEKDSAGDAAIATQAKELIMEPTSLDWMVLGDSGYKMDWDPPMIWVEEEPAVMEPNIPTIVPYVPYVWNDDGRRPPSVIVV